MNRIGIRLTIMGGVIIGLAACNNQQTPAHPPPEVTVSKPVQKDIVNWAEFTGRMAAVNFVKITSRVSGYIVDIPFNEGDIVHKGDLLFQIDPRPYQHSYEQAVGQLQQARANEQFQEATFARQQRLRDTGVIAKEDYDTALSNKNQAEAQVVSAQAAVDSAALNLEFTHVISPIDGRVSRQLVNIGNLVQADTTELTTIVSVDPIYAYFHVDELAELGYQRLVKEGKLPSSQKGGAPVYLQLQDETGFPHEGTINFADNAYDSSTGTLLVRGTFRNSDGFLVPGNFIRVRIPASPQYHALLVAERAIGSDQDEKFVYVVDSANIARLRHITLGPLANGLRVAKSGLGPDDSVIVNGIIKVRPTRVYAPVDGYLTNVNTSPGAYVHVGDQLLALVDSSSFWVAAYFKETQLVSIRPGRTVKMTLMGYHDEPFEGTIESVAWGIFVQDGSGGTSTGLLAAVNQTVDWVRLPQRYPVRIKITGKPPVPLRIGQTVTVAIEPHSSDKIAKQP